MPVIDLEVIQLNPDPVQYKPYSPTFRPYGRALILRIDLEDDLILEETETTIVVGPDGFAQLLSDTANLIQDTDEVRVRARLKRKP